MKPLEEPLAVDAERGVFVADADGLDGAALDQPVNVPPRDAGELRGFAYGDQRWRVRDHGAHGANARCLGWREIGTGIGTHLS